MSSKFLKEITRPVDPFYVRLIKGSNVIMPEFSNRGVFYTDTSGFNGTVVSNATNPLFDVKDYIYTSGTTSNLDFWGYNYTIPTGMLGKDASFKFNFKTSTSNFVVAAYALCTSGNKLIYTSQPITIGTSLYEAVFNIPTDCTGLKVGWQFIGTASGETFEYDNIIFSQWTPQAVNLVETQTYELPVASSGITYNGYLLATPSAVKTTGSGLFVKDSSVTHIRLKALKNIIMSGSVALSGSVGSYTIITKNGTQSQYGTVISSLGLSSTAFSLALSVGDYIEFYQSNPTTSYASYSITATAISENVVQSYAPSDFLGEIKLLPSTTAPRGFIPADGKSIGKTSGNYQGDAYYALYALRWAMASTTAGEPYVISSAKGASAQADWDAGKTITIDVRGMFFRAAGGNAGAVGSKQLDAFQAHKHQTAVGRGVNDANAMFLHNGTVASTPAGGVPGSYLALGTGGYFADGSYTDPRYASETRPVNTSEYAYMRYGTSAPDIIALPTSKENVFSARISSTGVKTSQNVDWIDSVTVSDTSLYTINISKLGLTSAPQVNANVLGTWTSSQAPRWATVQSVTATSIVIRTGSLSAGLNQYEAAPFEIKIQKQSPDYTAPGVFVGNVAKNQIVTVEGRTSSPQTIGTSATALILNSLVGDSTIATLSSNQITLQAGEYDVQWNIPVFSTSAALGASGWNYNYLYNVTDASEVRRGDPAFGSTTVSFMQSNKMGNAKLTLTAAKVFELRSISTQSAGFYVGTGGSSPNDLASWVKITKLNGQ